ncbi:flagellar biosynthesis protein FlgH [Shimia sp.]|uniref:flagellar biosynthesis protein FlgH n=1 Tax=Shimia sp. TaxID=1954381 RepID=UPI00356A6DEA
MLKKVLVLVLAAAVFAAAGYFAEPFLFRPPEPEVTAEDGQAPAPPPQTLFKMPLGKFVLQMSHKKRRMHLLFDVDIYIAGAANFEKMNGAMGRAQLRDTTIREISEMAEAALWIDIDDIENLDRRFLAEQLVRQLYLTYPMVRTARINQFTATISVMP